MLRNYFFKDVKNTLNYDRKASLKSLIIFRLIVFIYMNYVMTYNFVTSVTYTNMFVYMTIWGATFSYLYFFFTIVENISYLLNDRKQFQQDSLWQAATILYVVGFCFEIPIVSMYWFYLYPQGVLDNAETIYWINEISVHGIFCLSMLIDFYFNAIPFPFKFLIIQMTAALLYCSLNCVYVLTEHVEIYAGISWDNFISFIMLPLAAIFMIITFCLARFLYLTFKAKSLREQDLLLEDEQGQSLQNEQQQN